MAEKTLNIAVSNTSFGYDKLYSYRTGEELSDKCKPGMRVLVPFGNGNRKRIGLILSMGENPDKKLKPVISIIDDEPVIDDEMIDMIFWLKNTTFCTYFEAFRTAVPSGLGINLIQKYSLTGIVPENLDEDEQELLDILSSAKSSREFDGLLESLISQNKKNIIESLVSKNVIEEVNDFKRKVKDETIKMVCLSEEYLSNNSPIKITDRQKKVVEFIEQNVSASIKEVCYYCNVTPIIIKNLCKKNILNEYEYEEILKSDAEITEKIDKITLNSQQDEVFNGVSELIKSGKPSGALLYGITGSGKTAVFIKLIEYKKERKQCKKQSIISLNLILKV